MPRKRYKPEEIVTKLRQVDVLTSQGQSIADAVRQIGVTDVTYYRWRQEFGGLKADQVRRRCRNGSPPSAPERPISLQAVLGRTAMSRASMLACGTNFSMAKSSTHSPRPRLSSKAGDGITMPSGLTLRSITVPPHGGLRAEPRGMAACASLRCSASHAHAFVHATSKLTFHPDHLTGAGHRKN